MSESASSSVAVLPAGRRHDAAVDAATTAAITAKTAQVPTAIMSAAANAGPASSSAGTQCARQHVGRRELVRSVDHAWSQD